MPELVRHKGLEKTQLGSIASSFTILYGISKLISGIMSDNFTGKFLLSVGLFASGVCCLVFPCFDHVWILAIVWGCNGYAQGLGWPGCANILKSLYARSEIATWWSIASAAGNIGASVTPLMFTFIALNFGWENAFHFTGMIACFTGVLLWILLSSSPSHHVTIPTSNVNKRREMNHSWYKVLLEFDVWVVAFAGAILGLIRYGISDWSLLYFTETTRLTEARGIIIITFTSVGDYRESLCIAQVQK